MTFWDTTGETYLIIRGLQRSKIKSGSNIPPLFKQNANHLELNIRNLPGTKMPGDVLEHYPWTMHGTLPVHTRFTSWFQKMVFLEVL